MTENVRKIFDILGVEPNERFKLNNPKYCYTYYINENLIIREDKTNFPSQCNVLDIITENMEVIKIPKYEFTEEEKNVFKTFKQIGYNYIARDEDGELALYSDKPYKKPTMWNYDSGEYMELKINMFKSIKWEDSEPFEIPDFENEPEYETDKKKIEEKLLDIYNRAKTVCDTISCNTCDYQLCTIDCNQKMFIDELIENNFTFLKSEE